MVAVAAGLALVVVAGIVLFTTRDPGDAGAICEDGTHWQQHGTTIQDGTPVVREAHAGEGSQLAGVVQGGALLVGPGPLRR